MNTLRLLSTVAFIGISVMSMPLKASGLAVSPLKLSLKPQQQMTSLTVTNTGSKPLLVQGRVMTWVNSEDMSGSEVTKDMMLTPPLFRLAPGAKQLVRVGWLQQTQPPSTEQAFRVILQEVPNPDVSTDGIKVTLALSLPLFADATNLPVSRLDWELQSEESGHQIQLKNLGNRHQRFTFFKVTDAQQHVLLEASRLLYVLPGQQHAIPLPLAPSAYPLQVETLSDQGKQVQVLSAPTS